MQSCADVRKVLYPSLPRPPTRRCLHLTKSIPSLRTSFMDDHIPVQVKGSYFCVVSLVVSEVKVIWKSLLLSIKPKTNWSKIIVKAIIQELQRNLKETCTEDE